MSDKTQEEAYETPEEDADETPEEDADAGDGDTGGSADGTQNIGESSETDAGNSLNRWRWFRWGALLAGTALLAVAVVVVIVNVLLADDSGSGELNECEAILTFSAPDGPRSVMICPGTVDAYMDFEDFGELIGRSHCGTRINDHRYG